MTHAIVLITNGGTRLLLGLGVPEGDGARLRTGNYIDNETFQKNYPGSRIEIRSMVGTGQDEPG